MQVFLVDINASCLAELPVTSFEQATKRNVPALKNGDLVHARVTSAQTFINPTLSCVDSNGKASGMGVLKMGCTARVSTALARALLSHPTHPVLAAIGKRIKFEAAIGLNGLIWIHAQNPKDAVLISRILMQCEGRDRTSAGVMCEQELTNQFNL